MTTIVFTFARMNPPTLGHERLVEKILSISEQEKCEHIVYLSQSEKSPTNPLSFSFKRRIVGMAFPHINISNDKSIRNPYHALESLCAKYDKIILVVGGDRISAFSNMREYAQKHSVKFEIASSGNRVPRSPGINGISATKLRLYARRNKEKEFLKNLPSSLNERTKLLILKYTQAGLKDKKK